MLSERFKTELLRARLRGIPSYQLARRAGLHRTTLSVMLHGGATVRNGDPRIVTIGGLLGLQPHECFAESEDVDVPCGRPGGVQK
jgi:hypothetical protein